MGAVQSSYAEQSDYNHARLWSSQGCGTQEEALAPAAVPGKGLVEGLELLHKKRNTHQPLVPDPHPAPEAVNLLKVLVLKSLIST